MRPLGFRFDEAAILLARTAHGADCTPLPVLLPRHALQLSAGEVLRPQNCPRECACAPRFETFLGYPI
jgi:hypothetical protein